MSAELSDARWFKSSRSAPSKDCVEVAFFGRAGVGVRDSKNPTGPALVFTPEVWDGFTASVRRGELGPA
ncbi:DUF397 domain-containing protein [Nocardia cyriacigeorgica]|uniref:DUF397 domain-containing protein n=1 Tax=Nocardia cyriacigeorgica TaxID=135487 RepID=UPI001893B25E|nr:DUF397 domain-containing protein [Nocardia cyriacigeorgica]MBF6318118.1 DUF397 domain-containing protein [Nocardia cyriacigeorgica]MBF6516778.1 DUF397 domain-containing protein [Nocardia cyriacigeorgica]MBF6532898.1 DUF397 domain-containing protein [Nocardia cyriacigeorgica]